VFQIWQTLSHFGIFSLKLMQVLANGLVSGLVLGLLALAFAIVYLPTRILFLALSIDSKNGATSLTWPGNAGGYGREEF
jgi:uncharacterized membrane protein